MRAIISKEMEKSKYSHDGWKKQVRCPDCGGFATESKEFIACKKCNKWFKDDKELADAIDDLNKSHSTNPFISFLKNLF
jgi:uncharacterized C2H2 Zn-finger protein